VTAAAVAPPRTPLQESLAEAVWAAVLWHSSPDAAPGRAQAYEGLYDAVNAAPDDAAALELVLAAIGAGTAEAGDLAGIEDAIKSMTGVGK
jgi:hypothetical protein